MVVSLSSNFPLVHKYINSQFRSPYNVYTTLSYAAAAAASAMQRTVRGVATAAPLETSRDEYHALHISVSYEII